MKRGSIVAVCRSDRKGIPKRSIKKGRLVQSHGLEFDAHAGSWHRQVSVLDIGDIREMEAKGLTLRPGAFGENLVIGGIETSDLGLGSRLKLGEAEIEITQIGKVCHDRCAIYYSAGDCIMPRRGLFAEVRADGAVRAGDPVEVVHRVPRRHLQVAVLKGEGRAGDDIAARLQAGEDIHLAWSGSSAAGEVQQRTIRELCGRGLDLLVVVSSDAHAFSRSVDPGTEVACPNGLRGRVAKTLVALVDEDDPAFDADILCSELLAELHPGATPGVLTMPTLAPTVAGAQ